ncbi:putative signaling protein [Abditibacteriota bacterium]|nr:putative signaling protein [Abditibacteriota bacterium]
MTLRIKTLLLISGVLAALLLVVYAALRPLVMREFARVEQVEAKKQMVRAQTAIARAGQKQAVAMQSWSAWDSLYNWMDMRDSMWVERNFRSSVLKLKDLDVFAIVDTQGQIPSEASYDSNDNTFPIPIELRRHVKEDARLIATTNDEPRSGFLQTAQGLLWITMLPITSSDGKVPPRGMIVLGKKMTPTALEGEFAALGQSVRVVPFDQLSDQQRQVPDGTVTQNGDTTIVIGRLLDFYGEPVALLEMNSPNVASARGEIALNAFGLVLIGCGLFSLMAAMVPLEKLVLSPLAGLNNFIEGVRGSGDLSRRMTVQGDDEISLLATNINSTFSTLQTFTNRLRHSEHLFREMAQTGLGSGDAFFVLSQNSDDLEWHGDIDSLLGYEPGGLPRTWSAWLEHIFLNDKGRVSSACSRAFARREVITVEFRVIRCDGTRRYWMLRGKALLPKGSPQPSANGDDSFLRVGGEAMKMVGVCIDISERKVAEEKLRASQERLERIVETAADAIVIAEADGQLSFANLAAETVFGLTREEICSRRFDDAAWKMTSIDGTAFPTEESPFTRVKLLGEPVYEVQYAIERADSRRLIVSVNAAPLLDGRGRFAGMVASVSDVTERRAMEERLFYHAFRDGLTGLANRTRLKDRLEHALIQRGREEGAVAVLFVDLDNFKYINDSLGHAAGDEMLLGIARRLTTSLRAGDTAARFGGDEFVILLEQMDGPFYAVTVAERLLEALREPFSIGGREVFTTPSIGITFSSAGYNHPDELLRQADAALYEAKRRGKARYEVYQSHLGEGALKRLETENDLRRALQKEEFSLRFQPKWDLSRNQLAGFEALVRWEHPERGLVPPGDFIPIAEETGLIAPLGFWVLRNACFQAQQWRGSHGLPLTMAVNVSPHQLRMNDVVAAVTHVLQETSFPPENLILEITESAIVERTGETLETLNALKDLGVSLAIDDFGTGYSALAYLRDFPFDYLKIDRQFVTKIDEPGGNSVIVSSMISLAHALDLKVIAEGVEDAPEALHLKALGCDMGQGYFFARPLTANDIEARFGFELGVTSTLKIITPELTAATVS